MGMPKVKTGKIDELDMKILKLLLLDARTSNKDIAEACGISSPAVTKRIDNLKSNGIITGTKINSRFKVDISTVAVVGVNVENCQKKELEKSIKTRNNRGESFLTVYDEGIGFYDVVFGILARNMNELDELHHFIEGIPGVKRVDIHLWNGSVHYLRDNLC